MSKSLSLPITSRSNPIAEPPAVDYDRLIADARGDYEESDDDVQPDYGRSYDDDPSDADPPLSRNAPEFGKVEVPPDDSAPAEAATSRMSQRDVIKSLTEISVHDLYQQISWGSEKLKIFRSQSGSRKWQTVNELIMRPAAFSDFVRAFTGPGVYYALVQDMNAEGRRPNPRRVTISGDYWATYVKEPPTNQNPVNVHLPQSHDRSSDMTNEALLKMIEQQQSEIRKIYQTMIDRQQGQSSSVVPMPQKMSDETRLLIDLMAERERRAEARAEKLEDMFRASIAERVNQNPVPNQGNSLNDAFDLLGKIHGMYSQLNPEAAESGPSAFVKKILDNSDSIANLMDGGSKFIGNMVDTVRGRKSGNQNSPQFPPGAGATNTEESRLDQLESAPWRQLDDSGPDDAGEDPPAPGTFSLQ